MSNSDGFKPNPLLQQMYETPVIDEDVDLELSDEELELIARKLPSCKSQPCKVVSMKSDVFVEGNKIISFSSIQQFVERPDRHWELINYIQSEFQKNGIPVDRQEVVYGVIAENLRATAPINIKRVRDGFTVALTGPFAGQLCYLDTPCPF